jgi:hypothetical protein
MVLPDSTLAENLNLSQNFAKASLLVAFASAKYAGSRLNMGSLFLKIPSKTVFS